MVQFQESEYLYVLLLIPLLAGVGCYSLWQRVRAASVLMTRANATPNAQIKEVSWTRRVWKMTFFLLAIAALILATARPYWGVREAQIAREGRDILFLLDTSLSMLAVDVKPNRLEQASDAIAELVSHIAERGGHRIGLVAFAGRASLHIPLTLDYDLFLKRLAEVSVSSAPRRGSLIGDAIRQSLYGFGRLAHEYTDMIIVSDGEDHNSNPQQAVTLAADLGISVHAAGIGESVSGARIPLSHDIDGPMFAMHGGREVLTFIDQALLLELTRLGGGRYQAPTTNRLSLVELFEADIDKKPARQIDTTPSIRPDVRFQWLISLGLLLFAGYVGFSERKPKLAKPQ